MDKIRFNYSNSFLKKDIAMKKIYFAPDTIVVKVELSKIIASSPISITGDSGTGELQNEEGDGIVLSRGGSIWDEE